MHKEDQIEIGTAKPTSRRKFLIASTALSAGLATFAGNLFADESSLELHGNTFTVVVNNGLRLSIHRRGGKLEWQTSETKPPQAVVLSSGAANVSKTVGFEEAARRSSEAFQEGPHQGYRIKLGAFPNTDVEIEVVLGMDAKNDELLVQVGQSGGRDRVEQINHFYCIEKPVSQGGYVILPHGSGYLIPADTATDFVKAARGNIVGGRYTLPLFGMVKGDQAFYQILETYWDCSVVPEHRPGEQTSLDFNWLPSLGEFRYPRRFLWRFAEGLDYVGMAKAYRRYVQAQGVLRTLQDKSTDTPAVKRYVQGFEYRWNYWENNRNQEVLADLRKWNESGLAVNFFFPKWSSGSGLKDDASGWQAFISEDPTPDWKTLIELADAARAQGALIKGFIDANADIKGVPGYDPAKVGLSVAGKPDPTAKFWGDGLSPYFGPEALQRAVDHLQAKGFRLDALYFDGYSFHGGHPEDFSPNHPVSRKLAIEKQLEAFRETRRAGIMPGAEMPRFWSVQECDFFFFTDWSNDRLEIGEPVPLFELVFHDCYAASFSGGGYGKYDWPQERSPRLYELLFASAPGYNWLLPYKPEVPGLGLEGGVPIKDWSDERMPHRIEWLKRWSSYYQAIAFSEMISHEFLHPERSRQRIRFANGVTAEFDMAKGLCRIQGVKGFSGQWEKPHQGSL